MNIIMDGPAGGGGGTGYSATPVKCSDQTKFSINSIVPGPLNRDCILY